MTRGPRILTFNFHEPYLCLMAKTGMDFTVGVYEDHQLARPWQTQYRPIPKNITLVPMAEWRRALEAGEFDVVITHNESNAADVFASSTPGLLVCHNRKSFLRDSAPPERQRELGQFEELLDTLLERFTLVFISESKRADYALPGEVIMPGIDVEEYGGYTGEVEEVMRVGNLMRARNLMFDVDFQEAVCRGIRNRVVGIDPGIPGAKESESFEQLLRLYRTRRCLLHVTRFEYEDGYNLATLEAMACGMPVVSLANMTSPLTDGVDGFVSGHADTLRTRIEDLFADPGLAREIGARGRETVAKKYSIETFTEKWRRVIEEAAEGSRRFTPHPPGFRKDIVMQYVASPFTTGRYLEHAARKRHHVVTAGLRCPEEVLERRGYGANPPPYLHHRIGLGLDGTCREIREGLPKGFRPGLYLWVDSGLKEAPSDIDSWDVPKSCYLIDTHIAPELRIDIARHFGHTFLAQKGQLDMFRRAGIPNVKWLPLACSPDLHCVGDFERTFDVAYVGNPANDAFERRKALLSAIAARFPNSKIGPAWPDEMARVYAQSKIVVNACANRDVNMRVFEAMASGALLITDEADGLDDLFEDGKHLVVYRKDDEALDLIAKYLADDEARERIASAGRAFVRERHTYMQRIEQLLDAALGKSGAGTTGAPAHFRSTVVMQANVPGYEGESRHEEGGYYHNRRLEVAQYVPSTVRRLLDVGCGGGDFGLGLKEAGLPEVIGIEADERACAAAKEVLDDALLGDIEQMDLPFEDGSFDCVTFADVLEHLVEPGEALRKAARVLAPDGLIVASVPNVRFFEVVAMLAGGRWTYADAGIMDRTHLRFFTAIELRRLVKEAGLEILCMEPLCTAPPEYLPRGPGGAVTMGRLTLSNVNDDEYQDLLTFQYIVVAGKPGVDRLARAREALNIKEYEAAEMLAAHAVGADEVEVLRIRATATARIGQIAKAEELLNEALALRPNHAGAMGELGILLVAMNRPREARGYLERSLAAEPGNDRTLGALGLVNSTEGRNDEAFECLRKALEAGFGNKSLLAHIVPLASELGRLAEIEELLRGYADFYQGNAGIGCQYAAVLKDLGKLDEAAGRLDTILLFNPGYEAARELLADIGKERQ